MLTAVGTNPEQVSPNGLLGELAHMNVADLMAGVTNDGIRYERTDKRIIDAGSISGAYTVDMSQAGETELYLTLTGNVTLTISSPTAGRRLRIRAVQGGAGSFTITFPGSVVIPSTQAISWNTAVNTVNIFSLHAASPSVIDLISVKL